ncbi:hypothetical protein ABT119_32595 [Streptomyces sp. NPDC001910]|uniref:hypothetical protein n=1 Tax=Streptomyces sp. NPDC001910 TaxID=3154403 RepID=UPI00333359D7
MSSFPAGNFTIVNNETGRCVRVRLGQSVDVSDWSLGTKYLMSRTARPTLELGPADGSAATAWWFSTLDDALERQPFNQIVSYAVETFQNIGRFCVWMDTDPLTDEKVRERLSTMFENQLDSLPAETLARLTPLIPAEWMSDYAQEDDVRVECWDEAYAKVKSAMAWHATEAQAWAAEKDPLDAGQLAMLKAIGDQYVAHEVVKAEREFRQMMRQPRPGDSEPLADSVELSDEQYAFLDSINADKARVDRIWKRQRSQVEEQEKHAAKTLADLWQRRIPAVRQEEWHSLCVQYTYGMHLSWIRTDDKTQREKITAGLRTYLEALAKEGVTPLKGTSGARTRMHSTGNTRSSHSTYRWEFDGTHIYGADDTCIPSERTYWTDRGGELVGERKGSPGQTWTLAPWKPAPPAPDPGRALALTGLFGPLGAIIADAVGL